MDTPFTFKLNLDSMPAERVEDTIYNCLDFCLLCGKTAHFLLLGNPPTLWLVLEILREEQVTFSLLTEPEQSAYQNKTDDLACLVICGNGTVRWGEVPLGNAFTDRLADLWVVNQCKGGNIA